MSVATDTTPATQNTKASQIVKVGVIGAGQMGSGIAQIMAAQGGLQVVIQDIADAALEKAKAGIEKSLDKLATKGKIEESMKTGALQRLTTTTQLSDLKDCDLIIEAIVENEAVKKDVFKTLDKLVKPNAILASNTSSISITRLASVTSRPDQVIGMHFMNPVPLMKLVEIIRGAQTSDETYTIIQCLSEVVGKTTVVSQDFPGFISNRVLMPLINEAIFALHENVGSAEDIDTVMKLGMNHPMGPLQLADFIGLDTVLHILNVLHNGFNDPRFRPCPLLKLYVDAGYLGKKTGRGFYIYDQ